MLALFARSSNSALYSIVIFAAGCVQSVSGFCCARGRPVTIQSSSNQRLYGNGDLIGMAVFGLTGGLFSTNLKLEFKLDEDLVCIMREV
jgi:hypothetical protein